MTARPLALLQRSLFLLIAHWPGANSEQTRLTECHYGALTEDCVASFDLEDSRSQMSLLQTSFQVAPNTLPFANYDYGFPATDSDTTANQRWGRLWGASGQYRRPRNSLLSRWNRGEARTADGYLSADARLGMSRSAVVSAVPADATVNAGWNDMDRLRAELASLNEAVRHENKILELEQLPARSADAATGSLDFSGLPFSPLWFLVAVPIGFVVFLVYVLTIGGGVQELKEDVGQGGTKTQAEADKDKTDRLCFGFQPETHFMNFLIFVFVVGGFWSLWALNMIQPVLSQMVCYLYLIIVLLLLALVCYYELRAEIIAKVGPVFEKVEGVYDKTVKAAEEVFDDAEKVGGCSKSKGKKKGCC